nr:MAG: RNA dependent RNA polymerase [Hameenlinna totivirus 3]
MDNIHEIELYGVAVEEAVPAPADVGDLRQGVPCTPSRGEQSTMRPGGKYGDASVVPVNTFEYSLAYSSAAQDYLSPIVKVVKSLAGRIQLVNNAIVISNWCYLPQCGNNQPGALLTTNIPTRIDAAPVMGDFHLKWGSRHKLGNLDVTKLNEFVTTNSVDARVVAGTLKGDRPVGKIVADKLVSSFRQSTELWDNVALYTVGHLIVMHLAVLELHNSAAAVGVRAEGVITNANLGVEEAALVGPVVDLVNQAISQRRICLDNSLMTAQDYSLIGAIGTGAPFFTGPPGDEQVPILRRVISPQIRFFVFDTQDFAVPAPAVLAAGQALASLRRLASMLNEEDAFVRGYIRACSIAFGKISGEGANRAAAVRWFTAGLETEQTELPRPGGYNPIWSLLKLGPSKTLAQTLSNDYVAMSSLDMGDYLRTGVVAAGLYSLGVSAVFHSMNLTGRELNGWANGTANLSSNILRDLFQVHPDMPSTTLNLAACSYVQQATKCVLSPEPFRTNSFCFDWTDQNPLVPATGWQAGWGVKIPYIYEPLSMQWIVDRWCSLYGFSNASPEISLGAEIVISDNANNNMVALWQGEKKYLEFAAGPAPYFHIAYSGLLANAIFQQRRFNALPGFVWTPIYRSSNAKASYGQIINDPALQPTWYPDIFTMKVGSQVTYDYERGAVMGPVWPRRQLLPSNWEFLIRTENITAKYAGFVGSVRTPNLSTAFSTFRVSDLVIGGARSRVPVLEDVVEEGN